MTDSAPAAVVSSDFQAVVQARGATTATIERIVTHAKDTRSFFLRLRESRRLTFKPGQFLSFLLPVENAILTRPYSIASDPEEDDLLEICLNLVPGGRGSHYLFTCKIGDLLHFTGPWGTFVLDQPPDAECIFLADGTGIAPIRPMIRRVLIKGEGQPLCLLYGADTADSLLYCHELANWRNQYPRFRFESILRQPPPGWQGLSGKLHEHVGRRFISKDSASED